MKVRPRILVVVSCLLACAGVGVSIRSGERSAVEPTDANSAGANAPSPSVAAPAMVASGSSASARGAASDPRADGWAANSIQPSEQGVVGKWSRRSDGTLARCVGEQIRAGFPAPTRLELGPDLSDLLVVSRTEDLGENQGSVIGSLEGWPDSSVVLGYSDGAVSGWATIPDEQRSYLINQTEDGTLRVTEIDLRRVPECGEVPLAGGAQFEPAPLSTGS